MLTLKSDPTRHITVPTPPPGGGGGLWKFVRGLLVLAALGFLLETFWFDDSPQQAVKRIKEALRFLPKPAQIPQASPKPRPTPVPIPTATPARTATPAPTPTPEPEPQPTVTPKEELPIAVSDLVHQPLLPGGLTEATDRGAKAEMEKPEPTPVPELAEARHSTPERSAGLWGGQGQPFRHPGVVLTAHNLDEIRLGVHSGREPWKSWFAPYDGDPGTVGNEGQYEEYGRNQDIHRGEFQSDMWQLYRMAMLWTVKRDRRAAERGIGILENYARNHKRFVGVEASFMQGDCMNGIVAAEILRSTYPGWTSENTEHIKRYFSNVWWPTAHIGNDNTGAGSHLWTANQGTIGLKFAMAVAIFCDDQARFKMCLNAYLTDPLTGLENSTANGELGDTGRDTGHWTAQAIDYGWICQLAWAQGVDLFAQRNNRIIAISEFLAQNQLFALGECKANAPYIPYGCAYDFFPQAATFTDVRGREFMDIVQAYAQLKKIPAPFTEQLLHREQYKAVYALDGAIQSRPVSSTWVPPATAPVTSLLSKEVGNSHGSFNHSGDTWTLESDSKKTEDGYHFAYTEAKGDWTFVARVTQGGVIAVTDRLEPPWQCHTVWLDARKECSAVHYTHGKHCYAWPWDSKYYGAARLPFWLKLVRRGMFVYGFQSVDGVNWAGMVNVRYDEGLNDQLFVGLAAVGEPAKFDHVAFGCAPSSLTSAPTNLEARVRGKQVSLHWKSGANTVFCDVLRSEQAGGPYTTVAERLTTDHFTDQIESSTTYYYVISPASYSGRGPNSKEISAKKL